MGRLTGRTALVTGAGRNIGRATALALAAEGADVIVNARSDAESAQAVAAEAQEHGVRALPVLADLGDPEAIDAMVATIGASFDGVDVLVANAAVRPGMPFDQIGVDDLRHVMAVNFESTFRLIKAFSPGMRERGWGRIITNVGLNSFSGEVARSAVSASKMAVLGLTRSLSKEFAPDGVLVNCVSPGRIDTSRKVDRSAHKAADDKRLAAIPLGRLGQSEEIAALTVFLASDDAAYISGQMIGVNGGEQSL